MVTARKVIDWHHQGGDELARELRELPEGRYLLVPENELHGDRELTSDEEDGLIEALESLDRGDGIAADAVLADLRARFGPAR
jgi:hypothetical protein